MRCATEWKSRSVYTTVSESNAQMRDFLTGKGWVTGGAAVGQYRPGSRELSMYRFLEPNIHADRAFGLRLMEERDTSAVRRIVLADAGQRLEGIDDSFVDALTRAHNRRSNGNVNEKYKFVWVATDSLGTVRGVFAAGPKKGRAVKVMPLAADDHEVLEFLIAQLPHALAGLGHKAYTHQSPDPFITESLQRHGWQLEGLMPAAYSQGSCTAQWGLHLEDKEMRKSDDD